jgi:DDE superfamily endonuclease
MRAGCASRQEELWNDYLVSPHIFAHMVDRLRDVAAPSQHCLETEADKRHVHLYLAGLLSHVPRKNADEIAALVDVERLVMHAFSGTAPGDHRPLVKVLVGPVVNRWGAPDGVIAFDPRSFPKRGTHSVGVKRPWCGHRGKVDTCQVGVSMGSVSRGDHAVRDCRFYLPEDWARDEHRRHACHVSADVPYHTRHDQGLERLDLWGEQVPHGWMTGDEARGRHPRFRQQLRARGERYGLGGPCNTTLRDLEAPWPAYQGRGRPPKPPGQSVTAWRTALDPAVWTRLTGREGEKGPIEIEMIKRRVQTRLERKRTGPPEWFVVTRRPLADESRLEGKLAPDARDQDAHSRYHDYLTPTQAHEAALAEPSLAEWARVIKAGACIDTRFKRGTSEAGMDAYQVRTWEGWHHPRVWALIAVWFLISETHRGQQATPALTRPQVRYGLSVRLLEVFCTFTVAYICRHVHRQ